MTNLEASKIVLMLMAAYPQGERQSDETVRIYETMIQDLDFEQAKAAVARLMQSSQFLPTIAEVRAAASESKNGTRRIGMEAWGDVTTAIRLVGSYRQPEFSDALVAYVVRCLGWREICLGDNESALRARFIEAYDSVATREHRELAVSEPLRLRPTRPSVPGLVSATVATDDGAPMALSTLLPSLAGGQK